MATVHFLYRSRKELAPLFIRFQYRDHNKPSEVKKTKESEIVSVNYTDVILSFKIKQEVTKEYWAQKNKRNASAEVKNTKKEVDAELLKIETHLLKSYKRDFEVISINKDWLKKEVDTYYNPKKIDSKAFYVNYWIDYLINTAHKRTNAKGGVGLSYNTIKGYKDIRNLISRYQTLENTKIISLNADWFIDFFEWLKIKEDYAHNTAVKKVSILKTVINTSATKIRIPKGLDKLPIKSINTYDEDTDVIILSFDELQIIQDLDIKNDALINARKWLLLSCFTGQRGISLINRVVKENFVKKGNGYRIEIKQIKGAKKVIIPVLPVVEEIYKNGLPYKVSTQKLNVHFKTICKDARIDEMIMGNLRDKITNRIVKKERPKWQYIGTHTGRRSFASNHYGIIPTEQIMKVTGHSQIATFMKYIQEDTDTHVDVFTEYYKLLAEKEKAQKEGGHLKVIKTA
jgi:hypothetical protein